ncbi:MAG: T9SS type A sorting domain-containing protein [FCB group bacterium]|nr:T9SS type A sorting domain-containing protein [FCB group bacterium]
MIKRITVLAIFYTFLFGQFTQEWEVQQDLYERGLLYFDANQDSIPEITKFWWNTVTLYDGANNYEVIWNVIDDEYENLILWKIYDFDRDSLREAIFIRSNTYDTVTTAVMQMPVFSQAATWSSTELPGIISYLDAEDVDNDGNIEVVFGVNRFDTVDSTYYASLHVLDGATGNEEWSSGEFRGYITGPYLGDIDNDDVVEIMINLYDFNTENYLLRVYSYSGTMNTFSRTDPVSPGLISVGPNYPNPFNPRTVIPLLLTRSSRVSIRILNMKGEEVTTILRGELAPGRYQFSWAGKDGTGRPLPSGIYYYQVTTGAQVTTRPMVLLK